MANAISPSNFVLTNPELLRETLASNGENLVRGMHMLAEDIAAGKRRPEDPPGRLLALRDRREHRHHPRQGRPPERCLPAHPVRAGDRDGAQAPAADRARRGSTSSTSSISIREKSFIRWCGRTGPHRLRHLLGQPGRAPRHQELRGLHARGHPIRPRHDRAGHRRKRTSTRSAIASAARCWR